MMSYGRRLSIIVKKSFKEMEIELGFVGLARRRKGV